jgi:ceramide glucosyltransferase
MGSPVTVSDVLFSAALLGVVLTAIQYAVLRRHVASGPGAPYQFPPISILKPLCGVDEGLEENLAAFAALDYPRYEVVLGVRNRRDAAWPVAAAAVARWPGRFRLVHQRGEPGLNPKVNQLVGMVRAARHDLLVVSDSNVRVEPGYLRGIAWHLGDDKVGLVTHPVAGDGERSLGALFENLHLTCSVAPAAVAAQRLAGRDVVVGKSMALRRRDLEALGGFESVKDVLAEDFVLGSRVSSVLGKRVVIATRPIRNVNQRRSLGQFLERYARWCVMQRKIAGTMPYASQILLNPVVFALAGAAAAPGLKGAAALIGICGAKAALDEATAHILRGEGFGWRVVLVPVKDVMFAFAWLKGFFRNTVEWRGNRLLVLDGSRLQPVEEGFEPNAPAIATLGPTHAGPNSGRPSR